MRCLHNSTVLLIATYCTLYVLDDTVVYKMSNPNKMVDVGSVVRAVRPNTANKKAKGRATVATIQDHDKSACVLWESLAPKPLLQCWNEGSKKRRLDRPFLVTPLWYNEENEEEEERETTVPIAELESLLDFEKEDTATSGAAAAAVDNQELNTLVGKWKERGDQLLRLGDASAACGYYEMALKLSSILQVGSTVIVKRGGYLKLADVDCIDGDEIELSMEESDEECVVKEKEIIFCILFGDDEEHTQERLLLNLARCLKQLAELAKEYEMSTDRRSQYLKSAVLGATIAVSIAEHHKKEDGGVFETRLTTLERTALLLRSQAQAGLAKFQHAIVDVKKVLNDDPNHKEGLKQLQNLQAQQQRQKIVDKKLVKSMCKWVKTAADNEPVSSAGSGADGSAQIRNIERSAISKSKDPAANTTAPHCPVPPIWILCYCFVPVVIAYFLQQLLR